MKLIFYIQNVRKKYYVAGEIKPREEIEGKTFSVGI